MPSQFVLMLVWTAFFLPRFHAQTSPINLAPVPGIADQHNHMFAEHAFDGTWVHGTVEGGLSLLVVSLVNLMPWIVSNGVTAGSRWFEHRSRPERR